MMNMDQVAVRANIKIANDAPESPQRTTENATNYGQTIHFSVLVSILVSPATR